MPYTWVQIASQETRRLLVIEPQVLLPIYKQPYKSHLQRTFKKVHQNYYRHQPLIINTPLPSIYQLSTLCNIIAVLQLSPDRQL